MKKITPDDLLDAMKQSHRIFASVNFNLSKQVDIVPKKPAKSWHWEKLTSEQLNLIKEYSHKNFPSTLNAIKEFNLGELLRQLYIGEVVYHLRKFYSENKSEFSKFTDWYEFVCEYAPMLQQYKSKTTYSRYFNIYALLLECPSVLFLFLEKEHIFATINSSLIAEQSCKFIKFFKPKEEHNPCLYN